MKLENRLLLVEDEAPLRRSLEKYLKQAGYAFDSCSTAREALATAEKFHPGIVIAEYRLPDANGSVFLRELKRIVPDAATVMISEYDFQVIADELVRVGVDAFLKKPFDLAELEAALSSSCSKVRISMLNLDWKSEPGFKVYLPPVSRGYSQKSRIHADLLRTDFSRWIELK